MARSASAADAAGAYRAGDTASLASYGLDASTLDGLADNLARATYIADRLLDAPTHPLDAATRAAAIKTVSEMLDAQEDMSARDFIELLILNTAVEIVVAELTSQRGTGLGEENILDVEDDLRSYMSSSIAAARQRNDLPDPGSVPDFASYAESLAAESLDIYLGDG